MKRTILVPIDFSDATEIVMEEAAALAKSLEAKICLYHVRSYRGEFDGFLLNPPYVGFVMGETGIIPAAGVWGSIGQKTVENDTEPTVETRQLQSWQSKLHRVGIETMALLSYGPVVEEIVSEAARQEAILIVLGSHGRGVFRHMLGGSVCQGVQRHAPCPVVIVPTGARVEDTCKIAG